MNGEVLIIDTCSIRNFLDYYGFRREGVEVFSGIVNFFVKKIEDGEIILIDKVWGELPTWAKSKIGHDLQKLTIDTSFLFNEVEILVANKIIDERKQRYLSSNPRGLNDELDKYSFGEYADLYLIAYIRNLIDTGKSAMLVTDESMRDDRKLFPKLPVLCNEENIPYINTQNFLFDFYKDELDFSLKVK